MISCKFWLDKEQKWGENVLIDVYQIPLKVSERHDEQLATASFMSWEHEFPYELPLKPYTKCRLTTETDTFDYVVYSCDDKIVKMGAKLRQIEISLIEQLAITQEIYPDTLLFSHEKLTIFEPLPTKIGEVLERIRSQLWTVPKVDKSNPKYFPFDFYWQDAAQWTERSAPELAFVDKSLFEILIQIGNIVGGFPKIKWDEKVGKYFLTWRMWDTNVKDHKDENVVTVSRHSTIEGHTNILVSNLENLQNMSLEGENTVVEPCNDGFMPVSVEDYTTEITDEATGFTVSKPIARVLSMTFYHARVVEAKAKITYTDADTTRIFMEYDEWLTLPTYQFGITPAKTAREGVLWYKRGEKRIHNLAANGVGVVAPSPIRRIITDMGLQATDLIDGEPRSLYARITYIPYQETKYKTYKPNADKPIMKTYNQAEKVVSPAAIAGNMQGTVERAEGVYKKVQKVFERGAELYKIGEKLNGEIIVAADYEYGQKKIMAIYETAPFNRRSQHVGIDSKIRTWNIPNDNIQDRVLHYTELMEVEIDPKSPTPSNGSLTEVGHWLASYYNDDGYKRPDLAYLTWKPIREALVDPDQISTNYAVVNLTSVAVGKSICMTWEAADNASMGNRSFNSGTVLPNTNANIQNYISYWETARYLNMCFANSIPDDYNFRDDLLPKGELDRNRNFHFTRPALTAKAFKRKYNLEIYSETVVKLGEFEIFKDIRERIKFVYQLDFVGKNDTIVYERAVNYNRLVNKYKTDLRVWVNSSWSYNPYDTKVHIDARPIAIGETIGPYANIAIADIGGNLLFAVNKRGNLPVALQNPSQLLLFSNRKKEWVKL